MYFAPVQIWELAKSSPGNELTKAEFFVAMRYIVLGQANMALNPESLFRSDVPPLPQIDGISSSQNFGVGDYDDDFGTFKTVPVSPAPRTEADTQATDANENVDDFGDFCPSPAIPQNSVRENATQGPSAVAGASGPSATPEDNTDEFGSFSSFPQIQINSGGAAGI